MAGNAFHPFGSSRLGAVHDASQRPDSSCFADEVVVDFPSVAPALDRIRRAFLADERADAVSAAIQLSPRAAREGAMVPLELPLPWTCHVCGGRGETWTEPCQRCEGSGTELRPHHVQIALPAGVLDGTRFSLTLRSRHNPPTRVELRVLVA